MRHGICFFAFCIGDPVKRREPLPQWFGLQVKMPSLMCSWKFDSFGQQKFRALFTLIFFYLFDRTKAGRKILMKRLWLNQLIKYVSLKLGITINSSYLFSSTVSSPQKTFPNSQPPNQAPMEKLSHLHPRHVLPKRADGRSLGRLVPLHGLALTRLEPSTGSHRWNGRSLRWWFLGSSGHYLQEEHGGDLLGRRGKHGDQSDSIWVKVQKWGILKQMRCRCFF